MQETHNVTVDVNDGFNSNYDPSDSTDDSVDVIITINRSSTPIFGGGFFIRSSGRRPLRPRAQRHRLRVDSEA